MKFVGGLLVFLVGVAVLTFLSIRYGPGRLPGDIFIQGKNSTFYFPLMTCVIVSVVFSLVMWLLRR